jgi:5-methylcytosine-specific restriction endonuclease McrA
MSKLDRFGLQVYMTWVLIPCASCKATLQSQPVFLWVKFMSARKGLSKKTRFDVFKRDQFCCQYCGRKPPQTTLEVDHIDPVANGGGNEQTNLVTSCFECNRGKSNRLLCVVPESLSDRAARIKEAEEQLKAYRKIVEAKDERIKKDSWEIVHELFGDDRNEIRKDWFSSIKKFVGLLQMEDVIEAATIAKYKKTTGKEEKVFHYFCGVCWNKIRELNDGQI